MIAFDWLLCRTILNGSTAGPASPFSQTDSPNKEKRRPFLGPGLDPDTRSHINARHSC
jgi:hypothetical protein